MITFLKNEISLIERKDNFLYAEWKVSGSKTPEIQTTKEEISHKNLSKIILKLTSRGKGHLRCRGPPSMSGTEDKHVNLHSGYIT